MNLPGGGPVKWIQALLRELREFLTDLLSPARIEVVEEESDIGTPPPVLESDDSEDEYPRAPAPALHIAWHRRAGHED